MIYYALAGFAVIMAASFARRTPDKYTDFCVGISLPLFLLLGLPLVPLTGLVRPETLDFALRQCDLALGLDGFALSRWIGREDLFRLVWTVYGALPLMIAIAWVLEGSRTLIRAAAGVALLAWPFYLLVPAAGPHYAFAGFPDAGAAIHSVWTMYPRNCFPSCHFSWALLLAVNVHDRRWRWVFIFYAILMALATVAGGEHYFVDVIAAVPFTLAVQWLAENLSDLCDAWNETWRPRFCEILRAED